MGKKQQMQQWRTPLHHDQVVNNRNQDKQDEPDAQHANDTVQQTSNTAMDAQAQVVDNNVQETTNAAMEDPLHHDHVVNNKNQDEQDETDAQHADDTVEEKAMQRWTPPIHMTH
jgi:hypothetical protein